MHSDGRRGTGWTVVWILATSLVAACGDPGGGGSGGSSIGPREATRRFLEAATSETGNVEPYLTLAAREQWGREDGPSFDGSKIRGYELDTETVDGDTAQVTARISDDDREQSVRFRLRREERAWRLAGMVVDFGGTDFTVDFEGGRDSVDEFGEAIAEGLAESMQQSMQAWQEAQQADRLARQLETYAALESTSPRDFDAAWRIDVEPGGRPVRAVLKEILAGTGVRLEGDGAWLDRPAGDVPPRLSRVAAIEVLAANAGQVPRYEIPSDLLAEDRTPVLRFDEGPRRWPVTFAGPYAVEVSALEESAPNAVGKITLALTTLGMPRPALAMMHEMGEWLRLEAVVDGQGRELRKAPDTRWMGTPTVHGGLTRDEYSFELVRLLRDVRSIERIEGRAILVLPETVEELRIDTDRQAQTSAGRWTVTVRPSGTAVQLQLEAHGELEDETVRFDPRDAQGEPVRVEHASSSAYGRVLRASLNTASPPSTASVKIVAPRELAFEFVLRDVPLSRFAEQPAELEPLRFEGDAPLGVDFVRFTDRSNPDFVKVELALRSRANKVATQASVRFLYEDAAGTQVKDFPHTLTGSFGPDGQEPLAEPGASGRIEVTAFFMPPETRSLRVRLDSVEFADGTTWTREEE